MINEKGMRQLQHCVQTIRNVETGDRETAEWLADINEQLHCIMREKQGFKSVSEWISGGEP